MSNVDLLETLIAVNRAPGVFYRDTGQLFKILDNFDIINRRLKDVGRDPNRRKEK